MPFIDDDLPEEHIKPVNDKFIKNSLTTPGLETTQEPVQVNHPSNQDDDDDDDDFFAGCVAQLKSMQETSSAVLGASEEVKTAPLFSWQLKRYATSLPNPIDFCQYASIGQELGQANHGDASEPTVKPIFLNTDAPWSAFLCGSQGSGKSYTLSCILENCLFGDTRIGVLPLPMAGIIFHFDQHNTNHACEAAHLSSHVPVKVLVSPSNFWQRKEVYSTISKNNLTVKPLLLQDQHLNVHRMRSLMALKESDGSVPLYMETIMRILRNIAVENKGGRGFSYATFLERLKAEKDLSSMQKGPMGMRLQLVEAFMTMCYDTKKDFELSSQFMAEDSFETKPGTLTIVDLSDPFIDSQAACSIFDMCLSLFLENDSKVGRVIALDEAHKFMTSTNASGEFTESLLQLIREQRHKGARIIVSTQEPTISTSLLDLCSMTFIHRFTSPAWLSVLRGHLAGAVNANTGEDQYDAKKDLMSEIINLSVGESLLFCPSAMTESSAVKLGLRHLRFRTRPRLTSDGGRSVLASTGINR